MALEENGDKKEVKEIKIIHDYYKYKITDNKVLNLFGNSKVLCASLFSDCAHESQQQVSIWRTSVLFGAFAFDKGISYGGWFYRSDDVKTNFNGYFRPVIKLQSNITLTASGTHDGCNVYEIS